MADVITNKYDHRRRQTSTLDNVTITGGSHDHKCHFCLFMVMVLKRDSRVGEGSVS